MKKTKIIICSRFLLIACAAFFAGFQTSKSRTDAERALMAEINKAELSVFDKAEGKIYVTGHKSPDSDTVGCAVSYARLLCRLGYDAQPVLLGPINHESKFILDTAKLDVPPLLENAHGKNMVLVDHSEYSQSADGLKHANVLAVIDHHAIGSVMSAAPAIDDTRPLGSAATIVWIRHRNFGMQPEKPFATAMLGSILSDTRNLKAVNTTFADRQAAKALAKIAEIKDVDGFYRGMYTAAISYEGMSDDRILHNDYKEYERGCKKFCIGCVTAFDYDSAKDLANRIKKIYPDALQNKKLDYGFLQIDILHDDISCTYLMPADESSDTILKEVFKNDPAAYDGLLYKHEPFASRKFFAVPEITKVLESK